MRTSYLKIFFFFLCSSFFFCKAQDLVGIENHTIAIAPSTTVTNGTPIAVTGRVINTGTTSLTGIIKVFLAVNTSTNSTPAYLTKTSQSYTVVGFVPGSLQSFTLSTTASGANDFSVDGNGTTVVVWPVYNSNNATTADSSFAQVNIYMPTPTGLKEVEMTGDIVIPNPVNHNVNLVYDPAVYDKPALYSATGILQQAITNQTLDISGLEKGIYYLRFYHRASGTYYTRKLIIQ